MNEVTICDCGHPPSEHGAHTTGYGIDAQGKTSCYQCCADKERASMIATGRATLYLVRDEARDTNGGNGFPLGSPVKAHKITDWPGKLAFPVLGHVSVKRRGGGFGAQRTDAYFIGPDMFIWHAVNRGDMDIARCRRTKQRWSKTASGGYSMLRVEPTTLNVAIGELESLANKLERTPTNVDASAIISRIGDLGVLIADLKATGLPS